MKIIQPSKPNEWEMYYDLRWRILRAPWNQPKGSEQDPTDKDAYHLLILSENGKALGVGRMHFKDKETIQIRYMAVDDTVQGKGIGRILMLNLEAEGIRHGAKIAVLEARDTALNFYLKLGYFAIGKGETKFGLIPHTHMRKILQ